MGCNVNLKEMFGQFPVHCPHCGFDHGNSHLINDFDIECWPIKNGKLVFFMECENNKCRKEFKTTISFSNSVLTQAY
jgi:hypothetical protein